MFWRSSDPPSGIIAITCSDTVNIPLTNKDGRAIPIRGFMVTTAGNVAVVMSNGTSGIYPACNPGSVYPGIIVRILTTGTDHTAGIYGLY